MKRFIKLIVLFLIPVILWGSFCLIMLFYGGELFVARSLKPLQEKQLLGLAYTDIRAPFKYKMTEYYKPEVVALGSSRIMQVRDVVINDQYTFYNAGGAVNNIFKYEYFLDCINYSPSLFIISIDQWFFNANFSNQKESFNKDCFVIQETDLMYKIKSISNDFVHGKIDIYKLFAANKSIGLSGKLKNCGFSKDGSYYYGYNISNPSMIEDYNFKDTFKKISEGQGVFNFCDIADTTNLETIDSFLSKCAKQGISVIAFLPPFAPLVCERMKESGNYNYMNQILGVLSPVFEKNKNCYLYDYTDITSLGGNNYDFVDGLHGSEIIYNKIIQDIIMKNAEVKHFFKSISDIDSINVQYKQQNIRFHTLN